MTKKDYKLIANALHRALNATMDNQRSGVEIAADFISMALQSDNPRFKPDTFNTAVVNGKQLCK